MKKLFPLLSVSILFLVISSLYFNKLHNKSDIGINDQWHKEYLKKQERHEKGLPGNKELRIKEVQKYFKGLRTKFGENNSNYPANYLMVELEKAKRNKTGLKAAGIEWVQCGPGNVGGRTRSVLVDISDPSHLTWFAGSATGGAWKTTDGGETWENISKDIPYMATSTIVQSYSNPNILYIGTGESFPGSIGTTGGGIFKSIDKGVTWEQLPETAGNEKFRYVNRLTIDPQNADIVLAATTSGIYKTIDGGTTWVEKYSSERSVEDLKADTSDFNYIYAGVNAIGVLRSVDAGETWALANNGINGTHLRFEVAISPTNPDKIYASAERAEDGSDVFVSWDRGDNWNVINNILGDEIDYLGGQGGYDNIIAVHPYDEDTVFIAGVNSWKIGVEETFTNGESTITNFDTVNTASFLSFVNFGGVKPGISTGDLEEATDLVPEDFVNVEIRFGVGLSQKAHRFTVPAEATSGVPASDYTYQDYVDVPFEVWDITNNRQLMCSFRDQEINNVFDLYESFGNNYGEQGREYIFINSVAYDATTPDPNIAVQGGRSYKLIYFLWPTLAEGGTWEPTNLPTSNILIEYSTIVMRDGGVVNVSDAYGRFSGRNTYDQGAGQGHTSIPGFHPDHHALTMVPIDKSTGEFWVINGNDGGLGISKDNGYTFDQITTGYITTQFYGVSKKPYRNEYFGGMQDNGSWQSPSYQDANIDDGYLFRLGGDGFETVWNLEDTNKMMGSIYYNDIYRSTNHGQSWTEASSGINGDGPFITKLTMIPSNPNKVFAVGTQGLWYTGNFGTTNWRSIPMPEGWLAPEASITSSLNIKYSIANDSILWAGAALSEDYGWKIFVSTDQGNTFEAVNYPDIAKDVFISDIATHPTEPNTAYLLYSVYGESKILRTEDLGQSWEDITGFGTGNSSNNGFPDVGCQSLFVFPDNPNRIWAGTEIGIFESNDNGVSWGLLESNLPTVNVYSMFIQDNQVVVGTYGRGIWTYQYGDVVLPPDPVDPPTNSINDLASFDGLNIYPNPTFGIINIEFDKGQVSLNEIEINVYSINGRKVYSEIIDGQVNTTLDLSNLDAGQYIISIKKDVNTIITRKIIKK